LEAIRAGLQVIADKPFAPNAAGARELDEAAKAGSVTLGVFQNRRLDADIQTLAKLINDDRLGHIWRIHNRMDFDDPATLEAGPTGGLLRDLGSHLVDQMLWLLGPVKTVDAQLDEVELPEGRTDASFTITLRHESGAHSHISASKLNHFNLRELRAYGDKGAYVSHSTDVQAQSIFAGRRPIHDLAKWGFEPETHWGRFTQQVGQCAFPPSKAAIMTIMRDSPMQSPKDCRHRLRPKLAYKFSLFSTLHDKVLRKGDQYRCDKLMIFCVRLTLTNCSILLAQAGRRFSEHQ
jgi:predicted dehydrogenase